MLSGNNPGRPAVANPALFAIQPAHEQNNALIAD
jgi:hypothetical protein